MNLDNATASLSSPWHILPLHFISFHCTQDCRAKFGDFSKHWLECKWMVPPNSVWDEFQDCCLYRLSYFAVKLTNYIFVQKYALHVCVSYKYHARFRRSGEDFWMYPFNMLLFCLLFLYSRTSVSTYGRRINYYSAFCHYIIFICSKQNLCAILSFLSDIVDKNRKKLDKFEFEKTMSPVEIGDKLWKMM